MDILTESEIQFERLVNCVQTHLEWAKTSADRQAAESRWEDSLNFWKGKQWDGIKSFGISGRNEQSKQLHPNPVDNFFKAQVEGLVGDICDRPADIMIRPTESGDEQRAQKMERVIHHLWHTTGGNRKLEFITRRAVLHCALIAKVYWDASKRGTVVNPFVGDIDFFGISPANFFIDPRIKATDERVLEHAAFVIYAVRRSLTHIQKQYPEKGWQVAADTYASYVDTIQGSSESEAFDPNDNEALVIEYWYKGQPKAEDFPKISEDAPSDIKTVDGVHLAVVSGGVLLKHVSYAASRYPFVMEWMYPSDDSIYGFSDGHDMLMPQLIINKLNEIAIEGHALHSKGNWLINEGNIRNHEQFRKYSATGGAVLPVVDINQVRREHGGGVPGSLFAHYRQEQQMLEIAVGRFDINQGRAPRGVRAASAIALLLQQGAGRIRQRARAMASFIQQIVEIMIDLVKAHYTTERLIRVLGTDTPEWLSVSRNDFVKTQETEDYIPQFDIKVVAGADTTASKAYFAELAMQLFQLGVIDNIALLEILEFPRWREVIQRKQEIQAQAQEQAQAQAAPEVPAQGAPQENPYANIGGGVGQYEELLNYLRAGGV